MKRAAIILAALFLMGAEPAPAPDRPLPAAADEARARALFREIRCVVCQHESIADSPAGVAADMRRLVREEVAAGRDDDQIRRGLVQRYGDYVLFSPPVRGGTWLLWFGPGLLVAGAGALLLAMARRRRPVAEPLSTEEEARLAEVLENETLRPDPDASSPHEGR